MDIELLILQATATAPSEESNVDIELLILQAITIENPSGMKKVHA
jgi:hypothetical protein